MKALASFSDPATGALRLASGSEDDKTVRVWDPVAGGAALLVAVFDMLFTTLTVTPDGRGLTVATDRGPGLVRLYAGVSFLS